MESKTCFEVAVVGGGMVGAALARALEGMAVALIAARPLDSERPSGGFDSRIYALSPGNAAFLARLGAWQALATQEERPAVAQQDPRGSTSRVD